MSQVKIVVTLKDIEGNLVDPTLAQRWFSGGTSSGAFIVGETVNQASSGWAGKFVKEKDDILYLEDISGTPNGTGQLVGAESGKTYTPTSTGILILPGPVPVLSDPTGAYGVKRKDTGGVVVLDSQPMTRENIGLYSYVFEEPAGASGLVYSYWVEWIYQSRTNRDEGTICGKLADGIAPTRVMTKYLTWLKNEFKPLTLITPDITLEQQVENAIRYWNTHSAYKVGGVYDYAPGTKRVQLSAEFKSVVDVIPTKTTTWIWNDHPLWTLTGITVLDNVTTDLIMMSEAFRNYRIYVGTNFRWTFQRSDDPTVGGYLYCINVPSNVQSIFVTGTKRVTKDEDIKIDYVQDWILYYAKALVKQIEGNTLRKTAVIDMPIDGQALVDEGREEQEDLQEKLFRDGMWCVFIRRR